MLNDIKPFRMAGNIYFVGNNKVSCHLIDTGAGLILIDTGYTHTPEGIIESMEMLGFDIKDVKIILHSHGHYDHTQGTEKLVALSGAKTYLAREDVMYLDPKDNINWKPDYYFTDGMIVRLGNTEIECKHTPGHTPGVYSFFMNVEHEGKVYRAAMFGGAGVNQIKKSYLAKKNIPYFTRRDFYDSMEKLKNEKVDIVLGNHANQNDTAGKSERVLAGDINACIDPTEWVKILDWNKIRLDKAIRDDARKTFVNYAHRGASEYAPDNMPLSFSLGIIMGANGIETDIRRTADGALVLYHDRTIKKLTGIENRPICDETLESLQALDITKNGVTDKVITLEEFLRRFSVYNLHFALELKDKGICGEVAALIKKFGLTNRVTVTSFELDYVKEMHKALPEVKLGYLTDTYDDALLDELRANGIDEICPKAELINEESVYYLHRMGFNVRAWGVKDEVEMKRVYDSYADGMTVNYPDKLKKYIDEVNALTV